MVPPRLASLALCLLYVLHAPRDSSAYAHEGIEKHGYELTAIGEDAVSVQEGSLDDFPAAAVGRMKLGGRKMMVDEVIWRKEMAKGESSRISGATNCARKCFDHLEEEKQDLNVKYSSRLISHHKGNTIPNKFNQAGFVAFGADYHMPRRHPPKNN